MATHTNAIKILLKLVIQRDYFISLPDYPIAPQSSPFKTPVSILKTD